MSCKTTGKDFVFFFVWIYYEILDYSIFYAYNLNTLADMFVAGYVFFV